MLAVLRLKASADFYCRRVSFHSEWRCHYPRMIQCPGLDHPDAVPMRGCCRTGWTRIHYLSAHHVRGRPGSRRNSKPISNKEREKLTRAVIESRQHQSEDFLEQLSSFLVAIFIVFEREGSSALDHLHPMPAWHPRWVGSMDGVPNELWWRRYGVVQPLGGILGCLKQVIAK